MRSDRGLDDHLLANRFLDIAGHLRAEGRATSQEPGDDHTLSFAFSEQCPARAPNHDSRGGEDRDDEQHGYHQKRLCFDRHRFLLRLSFVPAQSNHIANRKKTKMFRFISATASGSKYSIPSIVAALFRTSANDQSSSRRSAKTRRLGIDEIERHLDPLWRI